MTSLVPTSINDARRRTLHPAHSMTTVPGRHGAIENSACLPSLRTPDAGAEDAGAEDAGAEDAGAEDAPAEGSGAADPG
jgi:hypothetical protein